MRAFWPEDQFDFIQGYLEDSCRKPDPFHVLAICERLGVTCGETWLVGDTPTDVETAARCGSVCVGVTWGFRTRADLEAAGAGYVVDHPDDIA